MTNSQKILSEINDILEKSENVTNYLNLLERPIEYSKHLNFLITEYYNMKGSSLSSLNNEYLWRLLKLYYEMTPINSKMEFGVVKEIIMKEDPKLKLIGLKIFRNLVNFNNQEDIEILFMIVKKIPGKFTELNSGGVLRELIYSHPTNGDENIYFECAAEALNIINCHIAALPKEKPVEVGKDNENTEQLSSEPVTVLHPTILEKARPQIHKKILELLGSYFSKENQIYLGLLKNDRNLLKYFTFYVIEVFNFSNDFNEDTLRNVAYTVILFGNNVEDETKIKFFEALLKKEYFNFSLDYVLDRADIVSGMSAYAKMLYITFVWRCVKGQKRPHETFERLLVDFIKSVKVFYSDSILCLNTPSGEIQINSNIALMAHLINIYIQLVTMVKENPSQLEGVFLTHIDVLSFCDFMINYDFKSDVLFPFNTSTDKTVENRRVKKRVYVNGNLIELFNLDNCKKTVLDLICVYIDYIKVKGIIMFYEDHLTMKELFMVPLKLNCVYDSEKFYNIFIRAGEHVFNTIVAMVANDLIVKYYDRLHLWSGLLTLGNSVLLIIAKKVNEVIYDDFVSGQFKSFYFYETIFPILYRFVLQDRESYKNYFCNYFTTIFQQLVTYNGSSLSPHFTVNHSIRILKDMFSFLNTKSTLYAGYCVTYSYIEFIINRLFELYCYYNNPYYLEVLFSLPSSFSLLHSKFHLFIKPIIYGIRNRLLVHPHITNFIVHIALFDTNDYIIEILEELFVILDGSNNMMKDNVLGILTKVSGKQIEEFKPKLYPGPREHGDFLYETYVENLIGKRPVHTESDSIFLIDYGNPLSIEKESIVKILKSFILLQEQTGYSNSPILLRKVMMGLLIYSPSSEWMQDYIISKLETIVEERKEEGELFLNAFKDSFKIAIVFATDSSIRFMKRIKSLRIFNEIIKTAVINLYSKDTLYQYSTLRFIDQVSFIKLVESTVLRLRNAIFFVKPVFSVEHLAGVSFKFKISDYSSVITVKKSILERLGNEFKCVFINHLAESFCKVQCVIESNKGLVHPTVTEYYNNTALESANQETGGSRDNSFNAGPTTDFSGFLMNHQSLEYDRIGVLPLSGGILATTPSHFGGMQDELAVETSHLGDVLDCCKGGYGNECLHNKNSTRVCRSNGFNCKIVNYYFQMVEGVYNPDPMIIDYLHRHGGSNSINPRQNFNRFTLFQRLRRIRNTQVCLPLSTKVLNDLFQKSFAALGVMEDGTLNDLRNELLSTFCSDNTITSELFNNSLKLISILFYNQKVSHVFVALFMHAYESSPREIIYSIMSNFKHNERNVVEYLIKLNKEVSPVLQESIKSLIYSHERGSKNNFLYYLLNSIDLPIHRKILYLCINPLKGPTFTSEETSMEVEGGASGIRSSSTNVDCENSFVITAIIDFLNNIVLNIGQNKKTTVPPVYTTLKNHKICKNALVENSIKGFYLIEYLAEYKLTFNDSVTVKNIIIEVRNLIPLARIEKVLEIYINNFTDEELIEILESNEKIIIRSQTILDRILCTSQKLNQVLIPSIIYLIETFQKFDYKSISDKYLPENEKVKDEYITRSNRGTPETTIPVSSRVNAPKPSLNSKTAKRFSKLFFDWFNKKNNSNICLITDGEESNFRKFITEIPKPQLLTSSKQLKKDFSFYTNINYECLIIPFTDAIETLLDLFNKIDVSTPTTKNIAASFLDAGDNVNEVKRCISLEHLRITSEKSLVVSLDTVSYLVKNYYDISTTPLFKIPQTMDAVNNIKNESTEKTFFPNLVSFIKRNDVPSTFFCTLLTYLRKGKLYKEDKYHRFMNIGMLKYLSMELVISQVNELATYLSNEELLEIYSTNDKTKEYSGEVMIRILPLIELETIEPNNCYNILTHIVNSTDQSFVSEHLTTSAVIEKCFEGLLKGNYKYINKFMTLFELLIKKGFSTEIIRSLHQDHIGYPPALSKIYQLINYISKEASIQIIVDYKPERITSEIFNTNLYHLLKSYPDLIPQYLEVLIFSKDKRMVELLRTQVKASDGAGPSVSLVQEINLIFNKKRYNTKTASVPGYFDENYQYYILLSTQLPHSEENCLNYHPNVVYKEIYLSISQKPEMAFSEAFLENDLVNPYRSRTTLAGICKVEGKIRELKLLGKLLLLKEFNVAYTFYKIVVDRINERVISYDPGDVRILEKIHYLILRKLYVRSENMEGVISLDSSLAASRNCCTRDKFITSYSLIMKLVLTHKGMGETISSHKPGGTSPTANQLKGKTHQKINVSAACIPSIMQTIELYSQHIHKIPKSKFFNIVLTNLTVISEIKNSIEVLCRPLEVILSFIKIWTNRFPSQEFIYFYRWRMHILEKQILVSPAVLASAESKKKICHLICTIKLKYAEKLINIGRYRLAQYVLNEGISPYLLEYNHKLYKLLMDLECCYNLREYHTALAMIAAFNITKYKENERGLIYFWAYKSKKALQGNDTTSVFSKVSVDSLYKLCKTVYPTNLIKQEEIISYSKFTGEDITRNPGIKSKIMSLLIELFNSNVTSHHFIIDIILINPLLLLKIEKKRKILYFIEIVKNERFRDLIYEQLTLPNKSLLDDHYFTFWEYKNEEYVFSENTFLVGEHNVLRNYNNPVLTEDDDDSDFTGRKRTVRKMYSIYGREGNVFNIRLTDGGTVKLDYCEYFAEMERIRVIRNAIDKKQSLLNEMIKSSDRGERNSNNNSAEGNDFQLLFLEIKELKQKLGEKLNIFKFLELIDFKMKLRGTYFQRWKGIVVIEENDVLINHCEDYPTLESMIRRHSRTETEFITVKTNFLTTYSIYLFFSLIFDLRFDSLWMNSKTGECKYKNVRFNDHKNESEDGTSILKLLRTMNEIDINGLILGKIYSFFLNILEEINEPKEDKSIINYISYFMDFEKVKERIEKNFVDFKGIEKLLNLHQGKIMNTCDLCISTTNLSIALCSCKMNSNRILERDNIISEYLEFFKVEKYLNKLIKGEK